MFMDFTCVIPNCQKRLASLAAYSETHCCDVVDLLLGTLVIVLVSPSYFRVTFSFYLFFLTGVVTVG